MQLRLARAQELSTRGPKQLPLENRLDNLLKVFDPLQSDYRLVRRSKEEVRAMRLPSANEQEDSAS
jgi:hypothetical protein